MDLSSLSQLVRISTLSFTEFSLLVPCPWLDGKHVVFGQVVDGSDVVKFIETQGSQSGKTRTEVVIRDCGEIKE